MLCLFQVCLRVALLCLSISPLTCACVCVCWPPCLSTLATDLGLFENCLIMFKSISLLVCILTSHGCLHTCMYTLHCHVASLARMPRLHCIVHALPHLLKWVMIEVEAPWFDYVHCITFEMKNAQLGLLGYHALKCALDGPRTKDHVPLSHKHDKGYGWCIHCLNCIAMQSSVLCCC